MQGFSTEPGTRGPLVDVTEQGRRQVWRWSTVVAVGGFLFGFDTGVISGALLFVKDEFELNAFQQGSVVSVLLLGAMAGAVSAGTVSDRLGRKASFGLQGVVFVVGTAVAVFSTGYWTLIVARFILGIAVGGASATVPVYLSENSPKNIRGRILTLNQLMVVSGILIAYFVNLAFSSSENWRAMFACGAVPALVMVGGALWYLPESIDWLIARGRTDEAQALVARVTDDASAQVVVERRQKAMQRDAETDGEARPGAGWRVLLESRVRPGLIVGLTLAVIQQFGGINTLIYYAPTIIESTGLSASNSIFYSVAIGIINLVMTLVAIRLIDKVGRRILLLVSLGGMAVTMGLLGLAFVAEWGAVVTLVCMVLYIAAFAVGMGPVFWVLIGEVFAPDARAAGSSASTAVNWTSNFAVSLVFLSVVNAIGQGQTFWIFAVVCAIGLVFTARYVPETKGRDAAAVDAALRRRFGVAEP